MQVKHHYPNLKTVFEKARTLGLKIESEAWTESRVNASGFNYKYRVYGYKITYSDGRSDRLQNLQMVAQALASLSSPEVKIDEEDLY